MLCTQSSKPFSLSICLKTWGKKNPLQRCDKKEKAVFFCVWKCRTVPVPPWNWELERPGLTSRLHRLEAEEVATWVIPSTFKVTKVSFLEISKYPTQNKYPVSSAELLEVPFFSIGEPHVRLYQLAKSHFYFQDAFLFSHFRHFGHFPQFAFDP